MRRADGAAAIGTATDAAVVTDFEEVTVEICRLCDGTIICMRDKIGPAASLRSEGKSVELRDLCPI